MRVQFLGILLGTLTISTANASLSKLEDINAKYTALISSLDSKCIESRQAESPPKKIEDLYCSNTPSNRIYVTYCLYQNLLVPGNNKVVEFELGESGIYEDGFRVEKVAMACKDLD